MRDLRITTIAAVSLAIFGCTPIPYADLSISPSPATRTVRFDSVATITTRVLGRHGFRLESEPCFERGLIFLLDVVDQASTPPRTTVLRACVRPSEGNAVIWFTEDRPARHLLPSSTEIVRELADSLRAVGRVRMSTR